MKERQARLCSMLKISQLVGLVMIQQKEKPQCTKYWETNQNEYSYDYLQC